MSEPRPGSWMRRLVGWCFALLAAAIALCQAVHIIESIWAQLAIGTGVITIGVGIVALVRRRSRF